MRVLQAMAGAPVGGAETFFTRLCGALQRAGLDQHLLVRPDPVREAALRGAGAEVSTARFGSRLDLTTARRLRRVVGSYRPDIVLTWLNRATAFCPAPGLRGTPRLARLRTPRGPSPPGSHPRFDHPVWDTATN